MVELTATKVTSLWSKWRNWGILSTTNINKRPTFVWRQIRWKLTYFFFLQANLEAILQFCSDSHHDTPDTSTCSPASLINLSAYRAMACVGLYMPGFSSLISMDARCLLIGLDTNIYSSFNMIFYWMPTPSIDARWMAELSLRWAALYTPLGHILME